MRTDSGLNSQEVKEFEHLSDNLWKRLVTVVQAAKFLGCSVQKLNNDRWLSKGCPYIKLHGKVYYDINDLKKFLKEKLQRVVPNA